MNHRVFRGSQFSFSPSNSDLPLSDLLTHLLSLLKVLAEENGLSLLPQPSKPKSTTTKLAPGLKAPPRRPQKALPRPSQSTDKGSLVSIWQGNKEQWRDIVHGVCRTSNNPDKPGWCGSTNKRTSGYAVREYLDFCLLSVFDREVERSLGSKGFEKVWSG